MTRCLSLICEVQQETPSFHSGGICSLRIILSCPRSTTRSSGVSTSIFIHISCSNFKRLIRSFPFPNFHLHDPSTQSPTQFTWKGQSADPATHNPHNAADSSHAPLFYHQPSPSKITHTHHSTETYNQYDPPTYPHPSSQHNTNLSYASKVDQYIPADKTLHRSRVIELIHSFYCSVVGGVIEAFFVVDADCEVGEETGFLDCSMVMERRASSTGGEDCKHRPVDHNCLVSTYRFYTRDCLLKLSTFCLS